MSSGSGRKDELPTFAIYCFWSIFGIYWIILTPLTMYWTYRFYQLSIRNVPFIVKRHPQFVISTVLLSNVYPVIIKPITELVPIYFGLDRSAPIFIELDNYIHIINLLFTIRMWLLYYDYTSSEQSLSLKWKQLILKTDIDAALPWSVKYRWLGNTKILSVIAAVIMTIYLSAITTGVLIAGRWTLNYTQMLTFITFIVAIIIAFKIKKCNDVFLIQKEYFVSCACYFAVIILFVTIIVMFPDPAMFVRRLAMNMITCSSTYGVSLIATYWAIKQYERKSRVLSVKRESLNSLAIQQANLLTLEQILSTKDGFDLFANHLVKELSIENLFFVFEMVQIKQDLILDDVVEEVEVGVMIHIDVTMDLDGVFHEAMKTIRVPQRSGTIHFCIDDLRKDLSHIMNQYIFREGEFCVNISASTRRKLIKKWDLLQNDEENEESDHETTAVARTQSTAGSDIHHQALPSVSPGIFGEIITALPLPRYQVSLSVNDAAKELCDKRERDNEKVKDYLKIFDGAMKEVITLMKRDSLTRFYDTDEYETMG